MKVKTVTRYLDDNEFEAVNESGNIVKIDMYPADQKKAQSPTELVLSAVAACAAVDTVQILKKKRKTVNDLKIETEGIRKEDHPHAFTHITMRFILYSPDTTVEELEKVVDLAVNKYCSVSESLKGSVNINHLVQVVAN